MNQLFIKADLGKNVPSWTVFTKFWYKSTGSLRDPLLMSTPVEIKKNISDDHLSGTSLRSLRDNMGYVWTV